MKKLHLTDTEWIDYNDELGETSAERVEHNTNNIKWLKENGGSGPGPDPETVKSSEIEVDHSYEPLKGINPWYDQISANRQETKELVNEIIHLTDEIVDLESDVSKVKNDIHTINAEIGFQAKEIITNSDNILNNQATIEDLAIEVDANTEDVKALKESQTAQDNRITANTQSIADNYHQIQDNSKRIGDLEDDALKFRTVWQGAIKGNEQHKISNWAYIYKKGIQINFTYHASDGYFQGMSYMFFKNELQIGNNIRLWGNKPTTDQFIYIYLDGVDTYIQNRIAPNQEIRIAMREII